MSLTDGVFWSKLIEDIDDSDLGAAMKERSLMFGRRSLLKWSGVTLSASFTSGYAETGGSSPPPGQRSARPRPAGLVFSADFTQHLTGP